LYFVRGAGNPGCVGIYLTYQFVVYKICTFYGKSVIVKKILSLWVAAAISFTPQPPRSKHFKLEELAPGVWAAIQNDKYGHAICNAGIVDLGNKTVVFDPFMTPEAARDLKKAAEQLTSRKVTLVINSHFHNDHIRGDQVFAPLAAFLSTEWTRNEIYVSEKKEQQWENKNAAASAAAERKKLNTATTPEKLELIMWIGYYEGIQQSLPELKITVPDLSFSDTLWIHGSKRDIKLVECEKGHTNSDLVMILPKEGIAFMGDLLFVNHHPWLADGDAENLKQHLKNFRQDASLNKYVPGHGPVAGKVEMQLLENYITDVQNLVRKGIELQLPDSVIIQKPMPVAYKHWWFGRFYKPNIQFLCEQMRK
jgi:cyclase